MALARQCLGAERGEWALAMQAEFEAACEDGKPLAFAIGCLAAAGGQMVQHGEGRRTLAGYALALSVLVPMALLYFRQALGLAHLCLAWDLLEGDWASVLKLGTAIGAATITLRNGSLYAEDMRIADYVVLRDRRGPYLLPDRFVGTLNTGIETAGNRPPRPLRLDKLPQPNHILLPDVDTATLFRRSPAHRR